jgi:hypothetical protein
MQRPNHIPVYLTDGAGSGNILLFILDILMFPDPETYLLYMSVYFAIDFKMAPRAQLFAALNNNQQC